MAEVFVQLYRQQVEHRRVPRGEPPFFELTTPDHCRVVGVFHYWTTDERRRKTVDHHALLWVASEMAPANA